MRITPWDRAVAVERRGSRTFEDGHRLDVVGVDRRDAVTEVVTACLSGTAEVSIVQRHAVDDIERLVVARHLGVATEQHACGTAGTTSRVLHHEAGDLTGERVDDIGLLCFREFFAFDLTETVAQCLAVTLDAKRGDDNLLEVFAVLAEGDLHACCGFHGLGLITQIRDDEFCAGWHVDGEVAVHVGDSTLFFTFHHHAGADDWFIAVGDGTLDGMALLRGAHSRSHSTENWLNVESKKSGANAGHAQKVPITFLHCLYIRFLLILGVIKLVAKLGFIRLTEVRILTMKVS